MKNGVAMLNWIFTAVEFIAQLIVSPFVILTVLVLLMITKLVGRKVRQGTWKFDASWNRPNAPAGASLGA